MNDVVLAVCTGALRSFLLDGDELPDKPLVAVVPVSVRPTVDAPKGSNQVSSMFVQLPANLHDPLDRLMAIHEGTKGAKEEHNALGADLLLNWAEYATPTVFASAARLYTWMRLADRHRPIANLVISNVPGPDFPLYLGGAELKAGFPLGPVMDGMGVNITIMSYRGVLYWGMLSCPETIPRVWDLTAAIPRRSTSSSRRPGRASPPTARSTSLPDRPTAGAGVHGGVECSGSRGDGHRGGARAHRDGATEGLPGGVVGDHRARIRPRRRHRSFPGRARCRSGAGCRCSSRSPAAGGVAPGWPGRRRWPGRRDRPSCWPSRPPGASTRRG